MKKLPIIIDLETKEKFREVSKRSKLSVSLVGLYDYATGESRVFLEPEFPMFFKIVEQCSYIIGYNIASFDIPLLQAYYPGDLSHFLAFDILEDIRLKIGRRLALNDILFATLAKRKSGHGLQAVDYFRAGKIDELTKYCLDDVRLTKELFDYGVKNGKIYFLNEKGKVEIEVDWKKYLQPPQHRDTPLTLPF